MKELKSKLFILGIYPKCSFYKPLPILFHSFLFALGGALGSFFLNLWVAIVYLIYAFLWFFFIMPIIHCKNCYFKVKEITTNKNTGESIEKLLLKEQWVESWLQKHVECGKKWGVGFYISWFVPIILMIISFFLNFSIFTLLSLIGFVAVLVGTLGYVRYIVCPKCPIKDECHAAF